MKHEDVVGLGMLKCFDRLHTCGLLDIWHDGRSSLIAKPSPTCYDDPFLRDSSCDKHVIPLENLCLKLNMISLYAKCTKDPKFIEWLKPLEQKVGNNGSLRNGSVGDFRAWNLLYFYCTMMHNGSFVGYVVHNSIRMPSSHVRAYVLKLLEQLRGAYFDKFLMMIDFAFCKFHVPSVELDIHVLHDGFWLHCSHIHDHFLKLLGHVSEPRLDDLDPLLGMSCKLEILWRNALYTCKIDVP